MIRFKYEWLFYTHTGWNRVHIRIRCFNSPRKGISLFRNKKIVIIKEKKLLPPWLFRSFRLRSTTESYGDDTPLAVWGPDPMGGRTLESRRVMEGTVLWVNPKERAKPWGESKRGVTPQSDSKTVKWESSNPGKERQRIPLFYEEILKSKIWSKLCQNFDFRFFLTKQGYSDLNSLGKSALFDLFDYFMGRSRARGHF